jgi:hypothetical protein
MKNRMRELRSFGSVRGEGSNVLAYSENRSTPEIQTIRAADQHPSGRVRANTRRSATPIIVPVTGQSIRRSRGTSRVSRLLDLTLQLMRFLSAYSYYAFRKSNAEAAH